MSQNFLFSINLLHSLKRSVASLLSISLFFFQLFDHVGEAKVILRNTGKVGFKFSIEQPQNEEEEETDEEGGGQKKVPEEDKQPPDARQEKDSEQNEEGQEVRPGQPVVIPTVVSSSWDHFRCGRVMYMYVCRFFCNQIFCVQGLH